MHTKQGIKIIVDSAFEADSVIRSNLSAKRLEEIKNGFRKGIYEFALSSENQFLTSDGMTYDLIFSNRYYFTAKEDLWKYIEYLTNLLASFYCIMCDQLVLGGLTAAINIRKAVCTVLSRFHTLDKSEAIMVHIIIANSNKHGKLMTEEALFKYIELSNDFEMECAPKTLQQLFDKGIIRKIQGRIVL